MAYMLFGFALGTLIYWIIARYDRKHAAWINPTYILWLSILLFGMFVYAEWTQIESIFTG